MAMISDYGSPVRRPRRRPWQRDPRVVVAGVVTAVACSVLLGGNVYGALSVGQPDRVQVHGGDSVWSIASRHYQSGDVRDHVDQIIALNHLSGGSITPGEVLLLPAP
jgi:LysM domain-containing protein